MGTLYVDTGGSATNSGSTDTASPTLSGTSNLQSVAGTTVTLPAGTDTTAVDATAGSATQSSINLAAANNSNTKIFWITGKAGSGGASPTVTVSVAPTTGSTFVNSSWAIGGQHLLTNASIEAALRAGDTVIFNNSPASSASALWTFRNAGSSAAGWAKIKGKDGTRPVLTCTGTGNCIDGGTISLVWVENLEIKQTGGGAGNGISGTGNGFIAYNCKISAAAAAGIATGASARGIIGCEISVTGNGITHANGTQLMVLGTYIHDCGGNGITHSVASPVLIVLNSLIDTCAGKGILVSGATTSATATSSMIANTTVYGCGDSGLEISDVDSPIVLINSLFKDNGDAAGEYNVEGVAGDMGNVGFHAWNLFSKSSNNLSNLTANAHVASSEITSDPLMFNPAGGDFRLGPGSPARNAGFPGQLLGATGLGYTDLGALPVLGNMQSIRVGGGSIRIDG